MKHKLSITLILLAMFLVAQIIGLAVINSYTEKDLPYGMQPADDFEQMSSLSKIISIMISLTIAIALIFILMKFKWKFIFKAWFFVVIILALSIAINSLLQNWVVSATIISLIIAIPLAIFKIYKPNILVHNATELLIYPGIAAVFVPILSIWSIIVLLIIISIYDMWMVWKTGLMQKMAKFQMNELKIFGGFLIPYASKKVKQQIQKLRKSKSKKAKNKKFKVSLAILGGGDVVFPIITAGIFLRALGLAHALFIVGGALAGLIFLFSQTEPKKSYPAMPYITIGMFIAMILAYLIL